MAAELHQPKNFDQLYPGRFLKAGILDGKKVTLTIANIQHEKLDGEKGTELKAIMSFVGKEMQLVLCKTNALCIKAMFGPILAEWRGKKVTFYEGKVEVAGPMKGQPCIRVWGSPEIQGDINSSIKLPKRKAFDVVLHKTPTAQDAAPKGEANA